MRKTRMSQIEETITDVLALTNNKTVTRDQLHNALIKKGHAPDIITDTMNNLLASGVCYIDARNKQVVFFDTTDTRTEQEKTIEDALGINTHKEKINNTKNTTQKEITMKNKTEKPAKKDKTIVVSTGIDANEVKKTEYQQKQDNILISMVSVRDGIQTAIKALENNTLKQVKSDVYALLNTEARKHLSNDFITIITEANNCRVKKDYASELRIALKGLNALIENEADIQEKETSVIPIDKKVKALTPDTAMLISQLDLKEKSRFDTLFNLITEQDKKIKELSKLVSCHKDTINLLINRLQTVDGTNVSPNKKTDVKPAEKPVKTPEELQIEERQAYIVGLKGIDKVVFDILTTQKRLNEAGFLIMEALEDYTPKMIKASLAAMISNGLFDCTKNTYTIAPVSSFKGNKDNKGKTVEKPIDKPAKAKKTFTRGSKNNTRAFIEGLIAQGSFTRKDVIEQAIEQGIKEGTAKTYIVDGKSEKYCKFNSLVKEDKKTKILSF
jgi:hypothetical protein